MFSAVNCEPGFGIEMLQHFDGFLNRFEIEAGLFLNDGQTVVLNVFQVVLDQQPQHVAVRRLRRQLQEQAFLQISGADAGRIELLRQRATRLPPDAGSRVGRGSCAISSRVNGCNRSFSSV